MARQLTRSRTQPTLLWLALVTVAVASIAAARVEAAELTEDGHESPRPEALPNELRFERVVVEPEPAWTGWAGHCDGWNPGGPRIDVWVDRGDWATYRPGDQLAVYFRVDRPCYVTILEYAPNGRVSLVFPNRWSGSNFVRPGRTYRVPESRRYSLRIAGPGGVETLVACAHEVPWPSGPNGYWIPPYPPRHGRVVPGRPGGQMRPPGRHGRVVVGSNLPNAWPMPGAWPIPVVWADRRSSWGCDSASFNVLTTGFPWIHGGAWEHGPWASPYHLLDETFTMSRCADSYYRSLHHDRGDPLVINVECVESREGDPTEIVGRLVWEDGWGSSTVFRIDVEGKHGERPREGRVFEEPIGDLSIEIEIEDLKLATVKPWQLPRIEWIRFGVRVVAR